VQSFDFADAQATKTCCRRLWTDGEHDAGHAGSPEKLATIHVVIDSITTPDMGAPQQRCWDGCQTQQDSLIDAKGLRQPDDVIEARTRAPCLDIEQPATGPAGQLRERFLAETAEIPHPSNATTDQHSIHARFYVAVSDPYQAKPTPRQTGRPELSF